VAAHIQKYFIITNNFLLFWINLFLDDYSFEVRDASFRPVYMRRLPPIKNVVFDLTFLVILFRQEQNSYLATGLFVRVLLSRINQFEAT